MAAAWCLCCMERTQPKLTADCAGNKQREKLQKEILDERQRVVRARMDVEDKEKRTIYLTQLNKKLAEQLKSAEQTIQAMKIEAAKGAEVRLSLSQDVSRLVAANKLLNSRIEQSETKQLAEAQRKSADQKQPPAEQIPISDRSAHAGGPFASASHSSDNGQESVLHVQQQLAAIRENIAAYIRSVEAIVELHNSEDLELLGTGSGPAESLPHAQRH